MELGVLISRDPDGTYLAISPMLPECVSRGKNPKEALDEHRTSISRYIAAYSDSFPDSIKLRVLQVSQPLQGPQT